jgi:hypothetical protein
MKKSKFTEEQISRQNLTTGGGSISGVRSKGLDRS